MAIGGFSKANETGEVVGDREGHSGHCYSIAILSMGVSMKAPNYAAD